MKFRAMTSWLRWSIFGAFLFGGTLVTSDAAAQGRRDEVELVRVLIQFQGPPGLDQEVLVRRMGGNVERIFDIIPSMAATLPAPALEALALHRDVILIEEDVEVQAHDIIGTWGVKRIGCGPVHNGSYDLSGLGITGTGIKVAICDTGIDYNHPEFPELKARANRGYDFVSNDTDPMDLNYHGTHVAGTVAAAWDNTGVVGAAPNAQLYACRVLDANGSGSFSWVIASLDWCVKNGIHVANFSLGSSGYPGIQTEQAFANAAAAGLVIVASAGNSGSGADTVGYPAKFSSCIAVASTDSSDLRSSFSSTGPDVDIAAPGGSILSTYPLARGGGYAYLSGTSMAAPHVAGVAALMLSKGVVDRNSNKVVNDEVRDILLATAQDLGTSGPDNSFGFGLVQAGPAVQLSSGGDLPVVFFSPSGLTGSVASRTVTLKWRDNSIGEDAFEVQYGLSSKTAINWQTKTVAANTTSTSISLSRGTWVFRVRAVRNSPLTYTGYSNQLQGNVR